MVSSILLRLKKKEAESLEQAAKYRAAIELIEATFPVRALAEKKVRKALKQNGKGVHQQIMVLMRQSKNLTVAGVIEALDAVPLGKYPNRTVGLALGVLKRKKLLRVTKGKWNVTAKGAK